ncbi:hypothetical protein CRE_12293 [Caenorhabditis remanei]|uniref:Uncharacterized protein n=1 Tax=Caenorhabditis remanei TaxID=31234 RepID=E3NEP5_CAERE|nr:hypothetical protein CRE_12293 [Caenorhabditis remanei]
MYISWTHFYIPKVFAGLAFLVNPMFVYLIFTEKSNNFGNYRFLLLYFAVFNLIYSIFTILVPIVNHSTKSLSSFSLIIGFQDTHSYRYCFFLFLSDGWFLEPSGIGLHLLSARCSLVSGSYAVLLSHFIYRYLAIRNSFITTRFKLYMTGTVILFVIYFGTWNVIVQTSNSPKRELADSLNAILITYYTMYISWTHFYIPKVFAGLAFLVNPMFVYLIFTEKSNNFGNYRFLLLYFAVFDLIYSMFTILVPIVKHSTESLSSFSSIVGFQDTHSYRYCFFLFLSDGWFLESSGIGLHLLSARCSLVSGSYAVLLSHFIYRYLAIRNSFITTRFKLYMAGTMILFVVYFGTWNVVSCSCQQMRSNGMSLEHSCFAYIQIVQTLAWTSGEVKDYIQNEFFEIYGIEPPGVNIFSLLYNEGSSEVILRSWVALISLSIISVSTILSYFILGYLTIKKLNEHAIQVSQKTAKLQKDLLKALSVQTIIPICISFFPCVICWYSPIFNIHFGRFLNCLEVIALSTFPFCDPVAIVLCLPALRKRVFSGKSSSISMPGLN